MTVLPASRSAFARADAAMVAASRSSVMLVERVNSVMVIQRSGETILGETSRGPVRRARAGISEALVEQDAKDLGGATRSQHVVYVVPHDWASISFFLAPVIERIDESVPGPQALVLTADADAAAAV